MVLNISQGFQRIWMFCITLYYVPPTHYVFNIGRCYIASIGFHFEKDFYIAFKVGMFCIIQNWKYYIAFRSWTFCVIRNQKHSLLFLFGALTLQVSNFPLFYRPLIVHQSRSSSNASIRAAPARYTNLMQHTTCTDVSHTHFVH